MKKGNFLRLSARILCCLCLMGSAAVFEASAAPAAAQEQGQRVQGTVKDSSGEPLIGASVLVKGSTHGVATDANGQFTIDAKPGANLVVSYVGYKNADVKATNGMTVTLEDDAANLDEVVVLGYGVAQKKQDLSAAVGVISDPGTLLKRGGGDMWNAMQGQIPGVNVINTSGDPTSGPSMIIRGQGSPGGDGVLTVVDGVPNGPTPLSTEIESIVVLKDAASAAIYGAQSGSGGVILITTKKAKAGAPSVTFNGTWSVKHASNVPEGLNAEEELEMRRLSYANAGLSLPYAWDPERNPWIKTTRTNWNDEIFRNSLSQNYEVAVTANTEKSTNRFSFNYTDKEGVLKNTYNRGFRLMYDGSFQLNKWVKISEKLAAYRNRSRSVDTSSGYTGAILAAVYMPASATVYNPLDGSYGGTTTEDPAYIAQYGSNFADAHGDSVNPVRLINNAQDNNISQSYYTTTTLEIGNFIPGLRIISRFTYDSSSWYQKSFYPGRDEVGKPDLANSMYQQASNSSSWKTENTITYDNTFGKHTIGAMVSTTADHWQGRGFDVSAENFGSELPNLQFIKYANSYTANDWTSNLDNNVSLIGRLSYSFADRYFLTASFRRDWAGRLPVNKKNGDFPAVTGAWKISSEPFFPKSEKLNLLKIRASWGRIGNMGSVRTCYSSVSMNSWTDDEVAYWNILNGSNKPWGTMYNFTRSFNPNLTWETSEQFDLGIDIAAFNNRLTFSADYYNKISKDFIQTNTMNWPFYIGQDALQMNLGKTRNRGFELSAGWNDAINRDMSYYVKANFSYNQNKVLDIGLKNQDGTPAIWQGGGGFRNIPYMIQTKEGGPYNQAYVIRTAGIFQTDEEAANYTWTNPETGETKRIQPQAKAGDLKFVDKNNNGQIDDGDREYRGCFNPSKTYNFELGYTWKALTISAQLQGVGGAQALYVGKSMLLFDQEGNFNRSKEILDAWSPTNRGSKIPQLSKTDNNNNMGTPSDFYLEDADYLRIKHLIVNYDFTNLLRKCKYLAERNSRLELYFDAENLATFTHYSGMDPECGGWDALRYPVARTFNFGIRLTY